MLGIVPAAGRGSRIQPLGFSKELLPVGSRMDGQTERPCAVSEYLVRRMVRNGVDRICFIIGSGKSDILEYYAAGYDSAAAIFVAQPSPVGLCDAIFRAAPLVAPQETVLIGLPDTIWFPEDGFCHLPDDRLSFLLFPVDRPELFDAVVVDQDGRVEQIQVKQQDAATDWVWGAFKMPGCIFQRLAALWRERDGCDEYFGTLVNAYLAAGGEAWGIKAGSAYV
ncbi:MAG: nucleotidyltransferase family protein, partial [Mesorhizobium sp.]